jgi:hypothetical protein
MSHPLRFLIIVPILLLIPLAGYNQMYPYFPAVDSLDINNIKVGHGVHGDMWHRADGSQLCEYPKGSGKHIGYSAGIWMAGYDSQSQLYAAGVLSGPASSSNKTDYWPGPLVYPHTAITYASSQDWAKIWKLRRSELNMFLNTAVHTIVNTPKTILEWPALGNQYARGNNNVSLNIPIGYGYAPFVDLNNNGIYEPLQGDYPEMKGDLMLWSIFNTSGPTHDLTNSLPLQMEIHCMAYAYKRNSAIDNVIFYEYTLLNWGTQNIDSFVHGVYADMDMGYAFDDYNGFDSGRNLGIVYNRGITDQAYHDSIPMAGIRVLKWDYLDSCNIHTPAGSFMLYNNGSDPNGGDPTTAAQFNNYLRHRWRNGQPLTDSFIVGGNPVKYAVPSDPSTMGWSECSLNFPPDDRRFVIASVPKTLMPGMITKFAFALVASPKKYQNGCPNASFADIRDISDTAYSVFCNPLPISTGIYDALDNVSSLNLYPNPVSSTLNISVPYYQHERVDIYDGLGRLSNTTANRKADVITVDVRSLASGVYYIVYSSGLQTLSGSFIKE